MACQTILLDGAMGSRLQQEGLPIDKSSPIWNVERPEVVRQIHQLYVEAGAQVLLTNTFGAKSEAELRAALHCIQSLSGEYRIAGSVGPTTSLESISLLAPVVDFFVLETFSDLEVARKTFARLRDFRRQIVLSLAWVYDDGFRLRSGETLKQVIQEIRYWPLLAFGGNCALGTARMCEIGTILTEESAFDIWIKSNAGQPRREGDRFLYEQQPDEFASELEPLIGIARYLGGCCGTTENHIRALKGKMESCYD